MEPRDVAMAPANEIRILIIGKKSSGKSSLGNILLGKSSHFKVGDDKGSSSNGATLGQAEVGDKMLKVVDTPDLTTVKDADAKKEEVQRWKNMLEPQPHIVLLAIRCDKRYKEDDYKVYSEFRKLWEDESQSSKLVVAFTMCDLKARDIKKEVTKAKPPLRSVLDDAGERYIEFSDKESDEVKRQRVEELLSITDSSGLRHITTIQCGPEGSPTARTQCRILVVGKSGNGKSTLANVLLGRQAFETLPSLNPATRSAKQASNTDGLMVVDTPDIVNMGYAEPETVREIERWKTMMNAEPDAILLAVRCDARYTAEEYAIFRKIKTLWGEESFCRRLVVAFTFGDRQDRPIEEELPTVSDEEKAVLRDAGGRYVVFDNSGGNKFPDWRRNLQAAIEQMRVLPVRPDSSWSFQGTKTQRCERRILIAGKSGNGKSTLANVLLGRQAFETRPSLTMATVGVQKALSNDGSLLVVDTPDIVNTHTNASQAEQEVQQWKSLTDPEPEAILLAIRCDARYTAEEYAIYRKIKELWGEESFCRRLVVAFTFGDRQDRPIEEELPTVSDEEKAVLRDAGGRYVVFDNSGGNKFPDWRRNLKAAIEQMRAGR